MKRILLTLALLFLPSASWAQCNGVFPNNTVCGNVTGSSNTPRATSPSAFLGAAGGTNGQIQYNNAGALGGLTTLNNSYLTPGAANTFKGSLNGSATSDIALIACSLTYQITQWIAGTGWQCGLQPIIPSRAIAATLNLAAFTVVQTQGYTTAGDGGDGLYVKVGSGGACPFTDTGSQIWSLTTLRPFDVMACGAKLDGSTNDQAAFQAALTAAGAILDPGFGTPGGVVTCPGGRMMALATGVNIDNPITLDCKAAINFTGANGSVFSVGLNVGRNFPQNFLLGLRSITCSAGGNTTYGVRIYTMVLSVFNVGQIQGCGSAGLYCDGTGGTHSAQIIQHNTFNLGQIVNNPGYGILLDSLDAASSSCEANTWNIQNSYQNNINLQVDISPHIASTSNTFNLQSSDNATSAVVVDINGGDNVFNIAFWEQTIKIESIGVNNTMILGRPVGGPAFVSNLGGATNKCWVAGALPATC